MSAPINPIPLGNTAKFMNSAVLATYQNFADIPQALQATDTTMIHMAPNGNITNLAGPGAGTQGCYLAQQIQGEQQLPFEQVVVESAFMWGAVINRTNYPKRLINFRLIIYGATNYTYQLCDNRWWDGQDETQDGWLGVYTRFTGWRWIPVRPLKTVDTAQKMDPVAYGNNLAVWDINWLCTRPYYTKPTLFTTWTAKGSAQNAAGNYCGTITLANQGDLPTYVEYLIDGAGTAVVQDNNSSTMVTLPPIFAADGPCLVDSDPQNRTLTASVDPIDSLFYKYLASSSVLSYLMSNINEQGEPWWQRGYARFVYTVPAHTTVQFSVEHSNEKATITAMLPQRFKRSR